MMSKNASEMMIPSMDTQLIPEGRYRRADITLMLPVDDSGRVGCHVGPDKSPKDEHGTDDPEVHERVVRGHVLMEVFHAS